MAVVVGFAEFLTIGFQSLIWFTLLLVAIFGTSRFDLKALTGWENLATIILLFISYTFGILFDRISDSIFSPLDHRLRRKVIPDKDAPVYEMRLFITAKDDGVSKLLEYMRSRIRIARASAFNITVILIGFLVNEIIGRFRTESAITIFIFVICAAGLLIAFFAWQRITKTYYKRLVQAYNIASGEKPIEISPSELSEQSDVPVINS